MSIKTILTQLMTESDNITHDLTKYLALTGVATFLGLAIWDVVGCCHIFKPLEFGGGLGATFAGIAFVLGFKKES